MLFYNKVKQECGIFLDRNNETESTFDRNYSCFNKYVWRTQISTLITLNLYIRLGCCFIKLRFLYNLNFLGFMGTSPSKQEVLVRIVSIEQMSFSDSRRAIVSYLHTNVHYVMVNYLFNGLNPLVTYEPRHEKTCLRGFRPGPIQTGLYSHRWLEA